jgi:diguanylate cyclase (GGDEF)-like protein
MANFSLKCHLAWIVIVVLAIGNFLLACLVDHTNHRLFLIVEALSLMMICAVAIMLTYQQKLLRRQLHNDEQGQVDQLTGLYSRHAFIGRISAMVEQAQQSREPLSLLWMDIDRFRVFNERCGPGAGDESLRRIATMIQGNIRGWDAAARFGDDEFCVLLPATSGIDAVAVAERLRAQMATLLSDDEERFPVMLTATLGVACLSSEITSADKLMAKASQCLVEGKRIGGDHVIVDWDMALEAVVEV